MGQMPREFYRQRGGLIESGLAQIEMRVVFHHDQERLVPLVDGSYFDDIFSDPELDAIEWTLDKMAGMTASEASDYSHGEVGFLNAGDGDTIPYEAAYIVSETDDELDTVIDRAFSDWVRKHDGDETIWRDSWLTFSS